MLETRTLIWCLRLIVNNISQISQENTNIQSNGSTVVNSNESSVVNGGSNVLING